MLDKLKWIDVPNMHTSKIALQIYYKYAPHCFADFVNFDSINARKTWRDQYVTTTDEASRIKKSIVATCVKIPDDNRETPLRKIGAFMMRQ